MKAYIVGRRVQLTGFGLVGTVQEDTGDTLLVTWASGSVSSIARKLVTLLEDAPQVEVDDRSPR